jgi:hypothetical protein
LNIGMPSTPLARYTVQTCTKIQYISIQRTYRLYWYTYRACCSLAPPLHPTYEYATIRYTVYR